MKKLLFLLVIFSSSLAADNVLLFSGSTRQDSYNKKLIVEASNSVYELGGTPTIIDLREYPIPFYDGDLESESGMPGPAREIRKQMIDSQVIIIASPEYNHSVSAILKNVIDWTSRKEEGGSSREAYKGKTFLLLSTSTGSGGGKRGLVHLREIINAIGGTVYEKELSVPNAKTAFDGDGLLVDKSKLNELLSEIIKIGDSYDNSITRSGARAGT